MNPGSGVTQVSECAQFLQMIAIMLILLCIEPEMCVVLHKQMKHDSLLPIGFLFNIKLKFSPYWCLDGLAREELSLCFVLFYKALLLKCTHLSPEIIFVMLLLNWQRQLSENHS